VFVSTTCCAIAVSLNLEMLARFTFQMIERQFLLNFKFCFFCTFYFNVSSHLVTVPPGPHILSDILISSAVVRGEAGGEGMAFGVDPEVDPELAMVVILCVCVCV
jgi:hypothetical protein